MSITYNGYDLTANFAVEYHVERQLAAWEPALVEVPGRDGSLVGGSRALPVEVKMDLYAMASTRSARQTAMRQLASYLAVREPKPLTLDDEGGLYRMAMPTDEAPTSAYLNADRIELTFVCPDPRLYGTERTVSVGTSATSVTIGGTAPTSPTITVTATPNSSGVWKITNVTTGGYMQVQLTTGSSHSVVFDCAKRTVTVDNAVAMLAPACDWFELPPATYSLRVTSGSGTASVKYREMWW